MSLTPDRPAASGGSTLCLFASKQTQGLFGEWRSAQVQITLEWSQGWMCVHLWVEWRVSQSLIQVFFFYSFILFPSLVIKDKTNYKWSHFMRKVNAVFDFTPSDPTSNPPTTTTPTPTTSHYSKLIHFSFTHIHWAAPLCGSSGNYLHIVLSTRQFSKLHSKHTHFVFWTKRQEQIKNVYTRERSQRLQSTRTWSMSGWCWIFADDDKIQINKKIPCSNL